MTNGSSYDVIVIGSGMTGLTASKLLIRDGLSVANIEGGVFGGLITNINELEGAYSGSGADLASTLMLEVGELGCEMVSETVTDVRREGPDVLVATDGGEHRARAVIVATGARLRKLGVQGEADFEYRGVSQCADCDGPMFRGQDVVVVGGGDSALQEALVLSHGCASVQVVHNQPQLFAHPRWQQALDGRSNVTLVPMTEVAAIEGESVVTAVRLRSLAEGGERTLPCAGVFVYVGLEPAAAFLPPAVARDATGAVVTRDGLETSLENVFAAGAVRAGYAGTLEAAVLDAQTAAAAVLRRLRE